MGLETESQLEYILSQKVYYDSLVITDPVLQVDDPLILEVRLEHLSELFHLLVKLVLIVIVLIVLVGLFLCRLLPLIEAFTCLTCLV